MMIRGMLAVLMLFGALCYVLTFRRVAIQMHGRSMKRSLMLILAIAAISQVVRSAQLMIGFDLPDMVSFGFAALFSIAGILLWLTLSGFFDK